MRLKHIWTSRAIGEENVSDIRNRCRLQLVNDGALQRFEHLNRHFLQVSRHGLIDVSGNLVLHAAFLFIGEELWDKLGSERVVCLGKSRIDANNIDDIMSFQVYQWII